MAKHTKRGLATLALAVSTALGALQPVQASAASIDMRTFTCAQFQNSSVTAQWALLYWLDGYLSHRHWAFVVSSSNQLSWAVQTDEVCGSRPDVPWLEAIGVLPEPETES